MNVTRHRTRTGIEIGLVYMSPPKRELGSEAERIQGALLGSGGAMDPSTWRSIRRLIDDDIAINRSRFDDTAAPEVPVARLAPLRRPSVIPLDGSLLGRFARWVRNLRVGGGV